MLKTILSDHSSGLRPAVLDSKTLGPTWLRMAHSVQLVTRGGMVHLAGNPFFSYSLFLHREDPGRAGDLGFGSWDLGPGTWNCDLGLGTCDMGSGTWDLSSGTWDFGPGTLDLGPGTWDLGPGTRLLALGQCKLGPGTWDLGPGSS